MLLDWQTNTHACVAISCCPLQFYDPHASNFNQLHECPENWPKQNDTHTDRKPHEVSWCAPSIISHFETSVSNWTDKEAYFVPLIFGKWGVRSHDTHFRLSSRTLGSDSSNNRKVQLIPRLNSDWPTAIFLITKAAIKKRIEFTTSILHCSFQNNQLTKFDTSCCER